MYSVVLYNILFCIIVYSIINIYIYNPYRIEHRDETKITKVVSEKVLGVTALKQRNDQGFLAKCETL